MVSVAAFILYDGENAYMVYFKLSAMELWGNYQSGNESVKCNT